MNPHSRLFWTLTVTLLMWLPVAMSVLENKMDLPTGGFFFLIALAFAYVGTGVIAYLTNNYRETQNSLHRAQRQIELIEQRNERLNRRAADRSTDE